MTSLAVASRRPARLSRRAIRPRLLALIALAVIFLFPIYWMAVTSFKPEADTITLPIQWLPARPTLENYFEVVNDPEGSILRWTFNSILTALAQAVAHVFVCVLAAYAFARLKFPGRDAWFWVILSTLMLPPVVLLIPRYVLMLQLEWIDTYHALIWPHIAAAFGVFLLRQFFLTIPRDLEDAARIDGANTLQVIWHIIVPSSIPALVTLGVFAYMFSWNDYIWPLFTMHGDMQTLPVGLAKFSTRFETEYGKLMAATAMAMLPALVGFIIAQRHIVQGVTLTGLKD